MAPFLNPGFIRAVFGYPARRESNVFHGHIIAANSPDWVDVPFNDELEAKRPGPLVSGDDWKRPMGRENYDGVSYWGTVGRPLIEEALANGGFWTEVFDPDAVAAGWQEKPDLLPILYLLGTGSPGE